MPNKAERWAMMQEWADLTDEMSEEESKVIPGPRLASVIVTCLLQRQRGRGKH